MVFVVDNFDMLNIWSFKVSDLKMLVGYAGLAIGVLNLAIVVPQVVFFFFFSSITVCYSTFLRVSLWKLQNCLSCFILFYHGYMCLFILLLLH